MSRPNFLVTQYIIMLLGHHNFGWTGVHFSYNFDKMNYKLPIEIFWIEYMKTIICLL